MPFLNRLAIDANERTEQVIKTGRELVNDLSGENGEPQRDIADAARKKDILSRIVLEFVGDRVRWGVRTDESSDLSVEILDGLIGPLDFCSNSKKKFMHD